MGSADLNLSCRCGKLQGSLRGATAGCGNHILCHCRDCQAFARFLKAPEILDGNGGTAIYQTLPGRVSLTQGNEFLGSLRLSPTGLLRWYANCCGTPLGNTLATPGFRFVGIPLVALPEAEGAIGPLIGSFFAEQAPQDAHPPANFGFFRVMRRTAVRHFASLMGLAPGGSPYFADGEPVAAPHVLTDAVRSAAYGA